jgi:molecular chaperone GrpE (heat shock protein)
MTADDQNTSAARFALLLSARRRARAVGSRALATLAPPIARRRSRRAELEATLHRLQADFEHVSKRHTEQIERLEDLVSELIVTAEGLRRRIADSGQPARQRTSEGDPS